MNSLDYRDIFGVDTDSKLISMRTTITPRMKSKEDKWFSFFFFSDVDSFYFHTPFTCTIISSPFEFLTVIKLSWYV